MNRKIGMTHMRTVLAFIMLFISQLSFSQGLIVKELKQNINDGSAFHAPLDAEGHPCGLIKVRTDKAELKFKGNIVGEVENKTNEYWVYMIQGSGKLQINHPNFIPLIVTFHDYGIGEISSKATYILTLNELKYKPEKTGLTITIKPETSSLYIDDVFVDNLSGNGLYQLYLPKGEHVFRFEQNGFRPNVQAITTGKGEQNINVELESVMAELEVKCKTGTAEIFIDGELKGNGSWKGEILAGEHRIEAKQQNFESSCQTISIAEKERRSFVIPELKRSSGKFYIQTTPSDIPVTIDGRYMGNSPCVIEVESGIHKIVCNEKGKFGCNPYSTIKEIIAGATTPINVQLTINGDVYREAYSGNTNTISMLAQKAFINDDYEDALYWARKHPLAEQILRRANLNYGTELIILSPEDAEITLKSMELSDPNSKQWGHNWADIGKSYKYKQKYGDAIRCYQIACMREALSERIRYMSQRWWEESLGDCYKIEGNNQEAAKCYKKILILSNENTEFDGKNRVEKKLKELE